MDVFVLINVMMYHLKPLVPEQSENAALLYFYCLVVSVWSLMLHGLPLLKGYAGCVLIHAAIKYKTHVHVPFA